jgi:hypothetical protein
MNEANFAALLLQQLPYGHCILPSGTKLGPLDCGRQQESSLNKSKRRSRASALI